MNTKILIVLVALSASQLFVEADVSTRSLKGVKKILSEKLGELDNLIQAELTRIQNEVRETQTQIINIVNEALIDAAQQIQDGLAPLQELVKKREEQAIKDGLDISACEDLIQELDNLGPSLIEDVRAKVEKILLEVQREVDSIMDSTKQLASIVGNLQRAIDNCKSLTCTLEILAEVADWTVKVPIETAKILSGVTIMSLRITRQAIELTTKETRNALKNADILTTSILKCLDGAPSKNQ